jgi:hypothetical protein
MKANALITSVHDVLQQGMMLLSEVDAVTYKTVAEAPHSASIGQHYRHVLDHFLCLVSGMTTAHISYDDRERNITLERDPDHAQNVTRMLLGFFQTTTAKELEAACKVTSALDYSEGRSVTVDSNLARELAYCISHAVHHFAIVRLMCAELRMQLPAEFGIAPSTLRHGTR